MAAENLIFRSWKRSPLFVTASRPVGKARLEGALTLELSDDIVGLPVTGRAPYTLMAAADVAGLQARAILRTAPAPFARDAETTKLVHVDFADEDLPWRYSPVPNDPARIRPWLVLLVGTGEELQVEGNLANAWDSVLRAYDLSTVALPGLFPSYLWAHVQETGDVKHSRLVSPRPLQPQREYVAALVPAFNAQGKEMWTLEQPADGERIVHRDFGPANVLPVFYSWRFWTGEEGDFETLAAKLHLEKAGSVGKARLHYPRPVTVEGETLKPEFEVGGAIMSLQPDLGRVKPAAMNDEQLLDALRALLQDERYADRVNALMPPGIANPRDLTHDQKIAMLEVLAAPVQAQIEHANEDLDALNTALEDSFSPQRKIIPMPPYGAPWLADPDAQESGWADTLNDDPRFRGISGLGVWMGVEAQEALMDAAVQQAGALRDAGQRISDLAMGILAAQRLWDRRLPVERNERLLLFGPLMARMLTDQGGTVLERITSDTSPLTPALFSGAARRLLRNGTSRTRHLAGGGGGVNPDQVLDTANQPEAEMDSVPQGVPHIDVLGFAPGSPLWDELLRLLEILRHIRDELDRVVQDHVREYRIQGEPTQRELAERLLNAYGEALDSLLRQHQLPCEVQELITAMLARLGIPDIERFISFLELALTSETARGRLEDALVRAVWHCLMQERCGEFVERLHRFSEGQDRATFCDNLLELFPLPPHPRQTRIDLARLHDIIAAALDPHKPDAPACRRVGATIEGLDLSRLVRPEFPIGLDFPTWELLRQYDKEWLLPGVNGLAKDSITALQTNPSFIDAFLVGINTQFMSEMRWRDLAVARDGTPLRMFWGALDYKSGQRRADIEPLREWANSPENDIGDPSHQTIPPGDPDNHTGSRLIIVFRSDLFRRYPSTLVYLYKPQPAGVLDDELKAPPDLGPVEAAKPPAERRYYGPTFVGTLTPEITFFAFDVRPEMLDKYWLVLDEPPTELRFRNDIPGFDVDTANSATFAATTLDQPTRVAISGKWLEEQANG